MVESSNTADTATFPDHTEGSHASNGVYNTYDDEFTLPKYINHYPPINEVISKFYVMEEMKKLEWRQSIQKYISRVRPWICHEGFGSFNFKECYCGKEFDWSSWGRGIKFCSSPSC